MSEDAICAEENVRGRGETREVLADVPEPGPAEGVLHGEGRGSDGRESAERARRIAARRPARLRPRVRDFREGEGWRARVRGHPRARQEGIHRDDAVKLGDFTSSKFVTHKLSFGERPPTREANLTHSELLAFDTMK